MLATSAATVASSSVPEGVDELRRLLPCRVQKASVDKTGRLVLEVYVAPRDGSGEGQKHWVTIADGRLAVSAERPPRAAEGAGDDAPPAVQGLVRKEIVPSSLTAAEPTRLTFERHETRPRVVLLEPGADARAVVCAEVDEGLRILATIGGLGRPRDGRDLRRGRLYVAPVAAEPEAAGRATASEGPLPEPPVARPSVDPALASLRAALRAESKRAKRLVDALAGDLARHGDAARHEEDGELLKTALGRAARGTASLDVVDWEGRPRMLALDPTLDAKGNLAELFKRARRARAAAERTRPRLEAARARLAAVDDARAAVTNATPSVEAMERARALLAAPDAGGSARRKAAKAGKRQPWRAFKVATAHGDVVLRVGRGAKDNDALVKGARGLDVWLHARGLHGAHVIVPSTGADVEPELLLDAAHLAAHFSAARGEARVDVQHARVKHVKKPPGAPAGLVHVTNESVLHLRVDPARIERLLAAEVAAG